MTWRATGVGVQDLPPGSKKEVLVEGHPVLLLHHMEQVYATAARCTHSQGPLVEGKLQGNRLTCPRHGSVFDIKSGIVLQGPYGAMKTRELTIYPARVQDGSIEVDIP